MGRSPGICLAVVVGVAEERVVIALGGCCSPLHLDPRLPSRFPSRLMEWGKRGGVCVGECASARVRKHVRLAVCGDGERERGGFLKELDSTGVGEFPVAS